MEIILRKEFPTGCPSNVDEYNDLKKEIINVLSEKHFTISQVRFLFFDILEHFETIMPVTTETRVDL